MKSSTINKYKLSIIRYVLFLIFILILIIFIFIYKLLSSKTYEINLNLYKVYLAIDETIKIESNSDNLKYISLDDNIASVKNGIIKGVNKGQTLIEVKKHNTRVYVEVNVSDLYTIDILNNDKEYIKCNEYSDEENIYLDEVLEYKINNVGYKTRAGAVEAARFLTLEFPKKIHYFYENGRLLTNGSRDYVDGEGRYYHTGLYLSDLKKDSIVSSKYGPSIWGCDMYSKPIKTKIPNGLDCSGFVSWVLLNAGFDVGDRGAGISKKKTNDLDDLGEKIKIKESNLVNIKVGDLLSCDGHVGMLIGMDNSKYYIAEALDYDLHVLSMTKKDLLNSLWTYFINLDELYINDGKINNMW